MLTVGLQPDDESSGVEPQFMTPLRVEHLKILPTTIEPR
jgi:hypothetical protein